MSVDAVVYYRVSNATVSVANVENAHHSTRSVMMMVVMVVVVDLEDRREIFNYIES